MTMIFGLDEIQRAMADVDLLAAMERAFRAYSRGDAVVPPVGHLSFESPPGDVCVKYGYIERDDVYVIKIASGFYDNTSLGLPTSQGMMLIFDQRTGQPKAVLLDEGWLTDARTGAAGAVAARHLAPDPVRRIGVIGTGVQAREQLRYLAKVTPCRDVLLWGRSSERAGRCREDLAALGYDVEIVEEVEALVRGTNLIFTVTPSRSPLFPASAVQPGTLVVAVGSDGAGKQELDPALLSRATRVVADSRAQCVEIGELQHVSDAKSLREVRELGEVMDDEDARSAGNEIVVADLTGVAVQDIEAAKAAYRGLAPKP